MNFSLVGAVMDGALAGFSRRSLNLKVLVRDGLGGNASTHKWLPVWWLRELLSMLIVRD